MNTEDFIKQIEEVKTDNGNSNLKLGEILKEAEKELKDREFKKLLKDSRVGYKITQAKKFINFYDYSVKCNSTDDVIKLGVEKVDVLAKVENIELQQKLHTFVLNKEVSFRQLSNVVKHIEEKPYLTPEAALIEIENEKKVPKAKIEKVDKAEYDRVVAEKDTLKAENEELRKELNQLKQRNISTVNSNVTNINPFGSTVPQTNYEPETINTAKALMF